MSQQKLIEVVGLFGTCGDSKWRVPVIAALEAAGIQSFNPVVPDWNEECAKIEAENLATDKVIMMVITGETEAYGSLGESGWAALAAKNNGQEFILVIEDFPGDPKSPANRTRKLVRAHAAKAGVKIFAGIEEATQAVIAAMKS